MIAMANVFLSVCSAVVVASTAFWGIAHLRRRYYRRESARLTSANMPWEMLAKTMRNAAEVARLGDDADCMECGKTLHGRSNVKVNSCGYWCSQDCADLASIHETETL